MKRVLMLFTLCMILTACSDQAVNPPFTPEIALSGSTSDRSSEQFATPLPTKEISLSGSIPDGCVVSYDPPLDQRTNGSVTVTLTCEPGITPYNLPNPAFDGYVSGDCITEPDITVNGYTMMACNLGAQRVATSLTDELSYGYLYQRGNNYGFPNKDRLNGTYTPNSATAINTSTYGPSNPYTSDTFITVAKRSSSFTANIDDEVNNLRGGKSDTFYVNGPGTGVDRRGPCPVGYHVPSILERKNALGGQNPYDYFSIYKIPVAGFRSYSNTSLANQGFSAQYSSSSPFADDKSFRSLYFHPSQALVNSHSSCSNAFSIRCFKNF